MAECARRALWVAWLLTLPLPAAAQAADPALEQHVQRLSEELRCVVCQNQSLADSHAPLAVELKAELRRQLASGAGDDEVKAYLVQRYGDFVLFRPPLRAATWPLWFGPLAMLAVGLIALGLRQRRKPRVLLS